MINIALLGAGRIGAMHARCVAAPPRAGLSAVYDARADAALLASPTATHCDHIELAAAGKPALCEKPPDLDIARISPGWSNAGKNWRRSSAAAPSCSSASTAVLTPIMPNWRRARPAGETDHHQPRPVTAGGALVAPDICARCDDVDTAMVILRAASGALCHINCSRRAAYGYDQRVEAFGAHGMLISDNRAATAVTRHGADGARRGPLPHFFIERYAESYRRQLDAFVAAVENRRPAAPSFEDGRRALLLANAAEKALRRGQWAEVEF